ncbi:MAG: ferredoxin reductase [Lysobacterales bacterium]
MNPAAAPAPPSTFSRLLRSPWLHPLNDADAWEQLRTAIHPMWSGRDYPARVVALVDETPDTRSLLLQPVRRWPQHRAGQHVVLEVEIDGRRLYRSFSLSSAPTPDRRIRITVKRGAQARVSAWLQAQVQVGDVLRISAPVGEFLAPAGDQPLLLLSAGSGITPLMAILEDLHARGDRRPIQFLHACRTPADLIFAARLRVLATEMPGLSLHIHYSAQLGRFSAGKLAALLPDYARYQALVCGPRDLALDVEQLLQSAGVGAQLRSESYRGRVLPRHANAGTHAVHCSVTEQMFTVREDTSLLAAAEAAGLKPASGCRIGICKTCQCTKRSGSVLNLRTGELSAEPDQLIQLCVSVARSPLELSL